MLLDNGRSQRAGDAVPRELAVHPLRRLPQRLPGLSAHRRPRLRRRLFRADRQHPDAALRQRRATNPHLPHASSLCGACQAACPVKINIPHMLIGLRELQHTHNEAGSGKRWRTGCGRKCCGGRGCTGWPYAASALVAAAVRQGRLASRLPGPGAGWTAVPRFPRPGRAVVPRALEAGCVRQGNCAASARGKSRRLDTTMPIMFVTSIHIGRAMEEVFDFLTHAGNWPRWHPSSSSHRGRGPIAGRRRASDSSIIVSAGRNGTAVWTVRERAAPIRWVIDGVAANGDELTITYG